MNNLKLIGRLKRELGKDPLTFLDEPSIIFSSTSYFLGVTPELLTKALKDYEKRELKRKYKRTYYGMCTEIQKELELYIDKDIAYRYAQKFVKDISVPGDKKIHILFEYKHGYVKKKVQKRYLAKALEENFIFKKELQEVINKIASSNEE